MSAISDVLWPGMKVLEPKSELGGILADKPGYHNMRKRLPTDDYSVVLPIDKLGPDDEGSAIDWTFPDAKGGNYTTIAQYSKRLYDAGVKKDPRTYPMREFFGNTDDDTEVEGWSYYRKSAASSDKSHLWHIHISIHRKYINDTAAMNSILNILGGEDMLPDERTALFGIANQLRYLDGRIEAMATGKDKVGQNPAFLGVGSDVWVVQELKRISAAIGQVDEEVAAKLLVAPVDELANLLKQLPAERLAELKAKL